MTGVHVNVTSRGIYQSSRRDWLREALARVATKPGHNALAGCIINAIMTHAAAAPHVIGYISDHAFKHAAEASDQTSCASLKRFNPHFVYIINPGFPCVCVCVC